MVVREGEQPGCCYDLTGVMFFTCGVNCLILGKVFFFFSEGSSFNDHKNTER